MNQEIIDRLDYVEETYAGEIETWYDPITDTLYHVPIETVRDWDNIKKVTRTITYSTNE